MTWRWEYDPSEAYVIGGAPPAFVAEVEKKADELVRPSYVLDPATQTYRDGDVFTGVLKVVAPFPVEIDLGQV